MLLFLVKVHAVIKKSNTLLSLEPKSLIRQMWQMSINIGTIWGKVGRCSSILSISGQYLCAAMVYITLVAQWYRPIWASEDIRYWPDMGYDMDPRGMANDIAILANVQITGCIKGIHKIRSYTSPRKHVFFCAMNLILLHNETRIMHFRIQK